MISKFAAAIVLSVVTLFLATPSTVLAKSSDPKKTKALQKQLKALGPDAPASKVAKLVKKLTVLDPAKAATYVKAAIKTGALDEKDVEKLNTTVNKVVESSPNLTDAQKEAITKKVDKTVENTPIPPTPTPYQAMISGSGVLQA